MQSFLKFLLKLLLGSILFSFLAGNLFTYLIFNFSGIRYARFFKEPNQIVVLGNSRAVNNIWEEYWDNNYNKKLINMAYNGMTGREINLFIKDCYNENPNISFIIEVSAYLSIFSDDKSKINSYYYSICRMYPNLKLNIDEEKNILQKIFLLTDFNSTLFNKAIYYMYGDDRSWINHRKISQSIIDDYSSNGKNQQVYINEVQFNQLLDIVEEIGKEKFHFFISPIHEVLLKKLINIEQVISSMQDHITIYDMKNYITHNDSFADLKHTNLNGAITSTDAIAEIIQ